MKSNIPDSPRREAMNTDTAATYLGMSKAWLSCGRSTGKTNQPAFYKLGRRVVYYRDELDSYLSTRHRIIV